MLGNKLRILGIVDVVTKYRNATAECFGQAVKYGVHCATRPAPRGIEIDQCRSRAGDCLFEVFHIGYGLILSSYSVYFDPATHLRQFAFEVGYSPPQTLVESCRGLPTEHFAGA